MTRALDIDSSAISKLGVRLDFRFLAGTFDPVNPLAIGFQHRLDHFYHSPAPIGFGEELHIERRATGLFSRSNQQGGFKRWDEICEHTRCGFAVRSRRIPACGYAVTSCKFPRMPIKKVVCRGFSIFIADGTIWLKVF